MNLAAIYNIFKDSVELLPYSLNCLKGHVDQVIIVYQNVSNYGEDAGEYELFSEDFIKNIFPGIIQVQYTPDLSQNGAFNETKKRNIGLGIAKEQGCSHFLHMDSDEIYEDFGKAKQQFINSGSGGSVCQMWTYFKKPTLRFKNLDNYFVPFIHKLEPDTFCGMQKYPWYVDPTRRVNQKDVVLIEEKMHHFSWVRKDIMMKVRNSSARGNIANSNRLADYNNPLIGEGFYSKDYDQKLIDVPNIFNIEI